MQLPCKSIHISSVSMNSMCVWSSQTMQKKGHCKMFLQQWCFSHIQNPAKDMNIMNGEASTTKQSGSGWTETFGTYPGPIQEALMLDNFLRRNFMEIWHSVKFYHLEVYEFSGHKLLFLPCALCALNFSSLLASLPKISSLFHDFSLFGLWCHLVSLTWNLVRSFYQNH